MSDDEWDQFAIRGGWQKLAEDYAPREASDPRSYAPGRFCKLERAAQNRSLGWVDTAAGGGDRHLRPMAPEVYLHALASQFEELQPRLGAMRAEMRARPEEYEEQRLFDLILWVECGPMDLGQLAQDAERGLASFVCWVGMRGWKSQNTFRLHALDGFGGWSRRSLAAFATWARNPWFCDARGNDFGGGDS